MKSELTSISTEISALQGRLMSTQAGMSVEDEHSGWDYIMDAIGDLDRAREAVNLAVSGEGHTREERTRDMLTIAEATPLINAARAELDTPLPPIGEQQVRYLCGRGLRGAEKIGRVWMISRWAAPLIAEEMRPAGRPARATD